MILRREQGGDGPVVDEVRLSRPLDGLGNFRICCMSEIANLPANRLSSRRQIFDISIDRRIRVVARHG